MIQGMAMALLESPGISGLSQHKRPTAIPGASDTHRFLVQFPSRLPSGAEKKVSWRAIDSPSENETELQSKFRFIHRLIECSISKDLQSGRHVHAMVAQSRYPHDSDVRNALVHMYIKCGSLQEAMAVFHKLMEDSVVGVSTWTVLIAAHSEQGDVNYALHLFQQMQLEGIIPDTITLVKILEACGSPQYLKDGRKIHAYIWNDFDMVVGSCLITMYGKCGSLNDAFLVFQRLQVRNDVTWNSMMGVYVHAEHEDEALKLFRHMLQDGCTPTRATFLTVMTACGGLQNLEAGKIVHSKLVEAGYGTDFSARCALINMYGKCGSPENAVKVFEETPVHDGFSWTAMISVFLNVEDYGEAFRWFWKMQLEGIKISWITLVTILGACNGPEALADGQKIRDYLLETGNMNLVARTAILDMYSKCGSLEDAWTAFQEMPQRSVIAYNIMMGVCALHEGPLEALKVFRRMLQEGLVADQAVFLRALGACSNLQEAESCRALMKESGIQPNDFVSNALMVMYARIGEVGAMSHIFQELVEKEVRAWNSLILGYVENGQKQAGFSAFRSMMQSGVEPDVFTFSIIINACQTHKDVREVHFLSRLAGISGPTIDNVLISSYATRGLLTDAYQVFENCEHKSTATWGAMIHACTHNGFMEEAWYFFKKMQLEGTRPTKSIILSVLSACTDRRQEKLLTCYLTDHTLEGDDELILAQLVFYSRFGSVGETLKLFKRLGSPCSAAAWNAVIFVYVDGRDSDAVGLFREMQQAGVEPNDNSFIAIIRAYGNLVPSEMEVTWMLRSIAECGVGATGPIIGNALISFYAKRGDLYSAREVFESMPVRGLAAWNTMISASEQLMHAEDSLHLFRQMLQEGRPPDRFTMLAVLSACASLQTLNVGKSIHAWLTETTPALDLAVNNALVCMYARCGARNEARQIFGKMRDRDHISWNAMIRAYGAHCGGKYVFELFQEMQLEGITPDVAAFTNILTACSHAGLVDEGGEWFGRLRDDYHIEPDTTHYSCIVDLLGRLGRVAEAEEVASYVPIANDFVWTTLLGACKIHGDRERSKRVAQKAVELNPRIPSPYVILSRD